MKSSLTNLWTALYLSSVLAGCEQSDNHKNTQSVKENYTSHTIESSKPKDTSTVTTQSPIKTPTITPVEQTMIQSAVKCILDAKIGKTVKHIDDNYLWTDRRIVLEANGIRYTANTPQTHLDRPSALQIFRRKNKELDVFIDGGILAQDLLNYTKLDGVLELGVMDESKPNAIFENNREKYQEEYRKAIMELIQGCEKNI